MESTGPALLRAVAAAPDDDALRLVYADWLEECGDPRSEFIRLQCELAAGVDGNLRTALEARQAMLLNSYGKQWEKPLCDLGVRNICFIRGMPESIEIDCTRFLDNAASLFDVAPTIRRVKITGIFSAAGARALAESPHLANLTSLDLIGNDIKAAGARALAESPYLANLTALDLAYNDIQSVGARALAESPHLAKLRSLCLAGNDIQSDGAQALAESPYLANLTALDLAYNDIEAAGAQALAESPHLANLTALDLTANHIDAAGARALEESPHLANLRSLRLAGNDIGEHQDEQIMRRIEARDGGRSTENERGR